jgi:para-aminobenzoate synthetase/4-amino-4-deoxychorismate lyase
LRCRFDNLVDGSAFCLEGFRGQLSAWRASKVPALLRQVERAAAKGWHAAGFVAYEAAPAFDPALGVRPHPGEDRSVMPLACFGLFEKRRDVAPVEPLREPLGEQGEWRAEIDPHRHAASVAAVKEAIASGLTYQVNLTQRLRRPYEGDPFLLYRQLAGSQAGAYHAYLATPSWAVACGSPELFFSLSDGVVTTRPMKGTAPRGRWPEEDRASAVALRSSPKERAENVMIVDLLRNDLGRVAAFGSVEVPALWELERYPTVWQLTSTVRARLEVRREPLGLADLFAALFPCGSVTGAPKPSTMGLIARLEPSVRGVYCGAVGYVAPPDRPGLRNPPEACFGVAIRTAVVDRTHRVAIYGTGGGITWDSDSSAEWAEQVAKATLLTRTSATRPFSLLETMRYEPKGTCAASPVVNLKGHLRRLCSSAHYFGFPFSAELARRHLASAVAGANSPLRVRLRLEPTGALSAEAEPFERGQGSPLRLALDEEPVDHLDPMLCHKTTRRAPYDLRAARHPDADDVILVNDRGEVTETTRANLLVLLEGRWWTPPLDCGLLPGIERARLLTRGMVAERVIGVAALHRAESLATVSSLRGWRAATLVEASSPARHATGPRSAASVILGDD